MARQMLRAGHRLRAMRELFGVTREEMTEITGIATTRFRNIERLYAKMNEEDFYLVCTKFPEFMPWLIIEGSIDVLALKQSDDSFCNAAAGRIKNGLIPEGFYLERAIIND